MPISICLKLKFISLAPLIFAVHSCHIIKWKFIKHVENVWVTVNFRYGHNFLGSVISAQVGGGTPTATTTAQTQPIAGDSSSSHASQFLFTCFIYIVLK